MQWLTVRDLAKQLNRTEPWVCAAARAGTLPAIKVGHQWRFDPEQIETWKQRNSNTSLDPLRMTPLSAKRQRI